MSTAYLNAPAGAPESGIRQSAPDGRLHPICSALHDPVDGPRIPARWGTFPTQVCAKCGMWRIHPSVGPNDWQPATTLQERLNEDDDEL